MSATDVLQADQPLKRRDDIFTAALADDAVAMDIESGAYFGFNKVASEIWALLEGETSLRQICTALCARYAVTPEQCEADVRALLEKLLRDGLVIAVKAE